jgi:hypothetical protein
MTYSSDSKDIKHSVNEENLESFATETGATFLSSSKQIEEF